MSRSTSIAASLLRPFRSPILVRFMTRFPPTAHGSRPMTMATFSNRSSFGRPIGGRIRAVAGFARIEDGRGFPTNRSAGRRIITAAGRCYVAGVGFGFPEKNGLPLGSRGVKMIGTSVGLPCPRKRWVIEAETGTLPSTSSSASPRHGSPLSRSNISADR